MSKEFKPGNTYVFSTKKFRKTCTNAEYKKYKKWVDACNGRLVEKSNLESSTCGRFSVYCDWCKCVKIGGL